MPSKRQWLSAPITAFIPLLICVDAFSDSYTYDDLGQLRAVTQGSLKTTYAYDAAGNRESMVTTTANHSPTCTDWVIAVTGVPRTEPPTTVTLWHENDFLNQCKDSDGDTLILVSPAVPQTITVAAGETKVSTFRVRDPSGAEATAKLTVRR